jgi:tetratricopeptide (TPR) repeat protein
MNLAEFGQTARSLARNPLGIIALFIVLIYGIASLVFGLSSSSLGTQQKWVLIWFLVTFPIVVFFSFVWLVAKHSLKLYAPSDFRKDDSFVELNRKVSILEVRQTAVEVDPRGDSDSAFGALEALLSTGQIDAAKNLAKAFLKVKRYDVSLQMFEAIRKRGDIERSNSFLQYRAYSLMGLKRYEDALRDLELIQASGSSKEYDFWPRIALAYCHLKLQHSAEFELVLSSAVKYQGAFGYRDMVNSLYPELGEQFTHAVEYSKSSDQRAR